MCLVCVYAMSMACMHAYDASMAYVGCIRRFWIAQNVQLTELYIFQYDDVPGKLLEHFATVVNVGVWCGLCCVLVEKKMHKVESLGF